MMFLLAFVLFAALPQKEKTKVFGINQYAAETVETIEGVGTVKLNGTVVTQSLELQGVLISNNAQIASLNVSGEVNLRDTVLRNGGTITGYLQVQKSTIEKPLFLTSQKAVFIASKLQGITFRQDASYKGKQILELKQKTIVDGPITFESGKGEVHLYPGSQLLGSVTGGKVLKKH